MENARALAENFPFGPCQESLKSVRIPALSLLAGQKNFLASMRFPQLAQLLSFKISVGWVIKAMIADPCDQVSNLAGEILAAGR